jgi:hypothetical protein
MPRRILAPAVEVAVQRQDEDGVVGDLEGLGRHRHALLGKLLHLREEVPGVDDDAVADDGELAGPHHARRQQGELVGLVADDQRMAGIVAALEAHHDLGALAQPVDDLALALVAPLGADHCHVGHCLFPKPCSRTEVPARCAHENASPGSQPERRKFG